MKDPYMMRNCIADLPGLVTDNDTPMDELPDQSDRIFIENDLAGSFRRCEEFLRELMELSGQFDPDSALALPVLELPMLDLLTITSLESDISMPYLLVTVALPEIHNFMAGSDFYTEKVASMLPLLDDARIVWDDVARRHIILRKVLLSELPYTSSVMDIIANTADRASRWQASL